MLYLFQLYSFHQNSFELCTLLHTEFYSYILTSVVSALIQYFQLNSSIFFLLVQYVVFSFQVDPLFA
jgi:hypothetical protein